MGPCPASDAKSRGACAAWVLFSWFGLFRVLAGLHVFRRPALPDICISSAEAHIHRRCIVGSSIAPRPAPRGAFFEELEWLSATAKNPSFSLRPRPKAGLALAKRSRLPWYCAGGSLVGPCPASDARSRGACAAWVLFSWFGLFRVLAGFEQIFKGPALPDICTSSAGLGQAWRAHLDYKCGGGAAEGTGALPAPWGWGGQDRMLGPCLLCSNKCSRSGLSVVPESAGTGL